MLDRHLLFAPQLSIVAAVVSLHIPSTPVLSNWFVSLPTLFALRTTCFVATYARLHLLPFPLLFVAVLLHQGNPLWSLFLREASLTHPYTFTSQHALLRQHLHRLEHPRYSQSQVPRQPLKTSLQPFACHHPSFLQMKISSSQNISYSNKNGKSLILSYISLVTSIRR